MDAIFESVEQALHVSFMVISLPSRQKNTFRLALIQALEQVGDLTARQEATLEYLRGTRTESTINFEGLTGDEVRAQCAMVVAAVRDRLPVDERNAVWIRYARGLPARPRAAGLATDPGVPPSAEWRQGVTEEATTLQRATGLESRAAMLGLIVAHSFPREREQAYSFPSISRATGVAVRTLERAGAQVRRRLRDAEQRAIARLSISFTKDGVVFCESGETLS